MKTTAKNLSILLMLTALITLNSCAISRGVDFLFDLGGGSYAEAYVECGPAYAGGAYERAADMLTGRVDRLVHLTPYERGRVYDFYLSELIRTGGVTVGIGFEAREENALRVILSGSDYRLWKNRYGRRNFASAPVPHNGPAAGNAPAKGPERASKAAPGGGHANGNAHHSSSNAAPRTVNGRRI